MEHEGVVAAAFEIVEVAEAERLLAASAGRSQVPPFSAEELVYARGKSDPERRLAARLAAKRAAVRALGPGVLEHEIEVRRERYGAPRLHLSARAHARLRERGADRALVSLTHERLHAAASVLLLRGDV
jgi:holo-[acyl-carrier protein] synthase